MLDAASLSFQPRVITMFLTNPGDNKDKVTSGEHRGSFGNKSYVALLIHGSSAALLLLASWMDTWNLCSRTWDFQCRMVHPNLLSNPYKPTAHYNRQVASIEFFHQYRTFIDHLQVYLEKWSNSQLVLQYQQTDPITSLVWIIWQQTVNSLWSLDHPRQGRNKTVLLKSR